MTVGYDFIINNNIRIFRRTLPLTSGLSNVITLSHWSRSAFKKSDSDVYA